MSLTDVMIRNVKPSAKPVKLFDGKGLFLLVSPSGGKWWRFKYQFGGKEKLLSLGTYPEVTLKEARDKHIEARKHVRDGVDPSAIRKGAKAALITQQEDTFEAIAREWFAKFSVQWAKSHSEKIIRRLECDVFPWLGKESIQIITTPQLLTVLRRIETRGAMDTTHRVAQYFNQIFRYAIACGRSERNPAVDLRGALAPIQSTHHAAITDPKAVGGLMRAIDSYQGFFVTKCALRLAPLVFVRPGELRHAEWSEIHWETAQWHIPAERMKMKESHIVPLSRQSLEILKELQPLTGNDKYIFPNPRTTTRPMSENAILAALRRMGYSKEEMTGHGFRAMARTILDEVLQVRPDYIEHQLAHAVRDPNGRAYNRTTHLPERHKMMQQWADYLEGLRDAV